MRYTKEWIEVEKEKEKNVIRNTILQNLMKDFRIITRSGD
jgi:hypothetical protein